MYQSTKTFDHVASTAFRQWKADSHCNLIHGYGLTFKFVFGCENLDARNWVVDFGGLKGLKKALEDDFDHKLVIAEDDPHLKAFRDLSFLGVAELKILKQVGCEAFAEHAYWTARTILNDPRITVVSVECQEHGANSAIYLGTR